VFGVDEICGEILAVGVDEGNPAVILGGEIDLCLSGESIFLLSSATVAFSVLLSYASGEIDRLGERRREAEAGGV
jgi:hypothetical protein